MATSPLAQIPSTAVDAAGLSVTTAIRSAVDPRPGAIYEPVNLAAVVPTHFHPTTTEVLGGANFLMLSSQRWTAATPDTANPGGYTAHTVDTTPSWVEVNAATGVATTVNGAFSIPMSTANDSRVLTAAVSRGNDMLWMLNSVTVGDGVSAVVQHWHVNPVINTVNPLGEETLPTATNGSDEIIFDAGLQWSSSTAPYMLVYGLGSRSGQVYAARKFWGRVGYTGTPNKPLDSSWEFAHSSGWGPDPSVVAPVMMATGPMTSVGPLSFAYAGLQRTQAGMSVGLTGYSFVSTVQANGNLRSAQIFESLGGRPWQPVGDLIALGSVADGSYMGGTLQFQGPVGANPAMIDPVNSGGAIPYVFTVKRSGSGVSSLVVNWGLLPVPRLS